MSDISTDLTMPLFTTNELYTCSIFNIKVILFLIFIFILSTCISSLFFPVYVCKEGFGVPKNAANYTNYTISQPVVNNDGSPRYDVNGNQEYIGWGSNTLPTTFFNLEPTFQYLSA